MEFFVIRFFFRVYVNAFVSFVWCLLCQPEKNEMKAKCQTKTKKQISPLTLSEYEDLGKEQKKERKMRSTFIFANQY